MRYLPTLLLLAGYFSGHTQSAGDWYLYEDTMTQKSYYKDADGNTKTKPVAMIMTSPAIFSNIIPVMVWEDTGYAAYYLLKNGQKTGRDSLYFFDNTPDCEQEGTIRFQDRLGDKAGIFNKNGKVIIPAIYNDITPLYNGLTWAIKDAEKECWEGEKYDPKSPCEHWSWKGGNNVLINDKNELLAEHIDPSQTYQLDLYSLLVTDQPADTALRVSFKGINGNFYSFINQEKEFTYWLDQVLLPAALQGNLEPYIFDSVVVENEEEHIRQSKKDFLAITGQALKKKLAAIKAKQLDYDISRDNLNAYIFEGQQYQKYYNNCGDHLQMKYPDYSIIITHYTKTGAISYQEHFEFLRSGKDYQLIYVYIH